MACAGTPATMSSIWLADSRKSSGDHWSNLAE